MINKRFNVLLIEDSSDDAVLLQEELKETAGSDFTIEWVERMSKGLARLAEGGIDSVLLDLTLPDSRGVDSFKKVYKQAPDVPIILLTGLDDEKLAVQVLQMGAQDYLVKHFIDGALLGRSIRYAIERHRLSTALEESEQRFRKIFEDGPLGMAILGLDCRFLEVNTRMCHMLGYTEQELNPLTFFDITHPDDVEESSLLFQRMFRGQLPYQKTEKRYINKNQEVLWAALTAFVVRNDNEEPLYALGLMEDITELKQVEEHIRNTSRLASVGEIAAGVAHEINNPLTGVLGYSGLILEEDLPQNIRADVERVQFDAQRAAKIVQNLLSFAKKHEPEHRYMNLTPILERSLELKAYDFRNNNIKVIFEPSPDVPPTIVDEYQLIQVILNILNNAEQAMTVSHQRGQLMICTMLSGSRIRISISDDGPGIPPEHLTKIFEPFFSTKAVGDGTGLGLSVCHGIIQQHGGDLWAESISGQGTTFHIELPITSPQDEGVASQVPELDLLPTSTKHLLVVEDEPHIRDLLSRSLTCERYTVDLAEDGDEAWRKVKDRSYDCVITDLKMPGMGGQQLFGLIEGLDSDLARKVIFITGDTISPDSQKFVAEVDNPVLTKPFLMNELRQQISQVLEVSSNEG